MYVYFAYVCLCHAITRLRLLTRYTSWLRSYFYTCRLHTLTDHMSSLASWAYVLAIIIVRGTHTKISQTLIVQRQHYYHSIRTMAHHQFTLYPIHSPIHRQHFVCIVTTVSTTPQKARRAICSRHAIREIASVCSYSPLCLRHNQTFDYFRCMLSTIIKHHKHTTHDTREVVRDDEIIKGGDIEDCR